MDDGGADDGAQVAPHGPATVTSVVSPHLLVAQAVAASLRAAGVPVEAGTWAATFGDVDARRRSTGCVLAVLEDAEDVELLTQISDRVREGHLRVLVVTSEPRATRWGGLLESDAVEVVTSISSVSELVDVVERFVRGEELMAPEEREWLRAVWGQEVERRGELAVRMQKLSPQQLRVLEMLAAGRRVDEVAEVIGIAPGTVRSHIKTLRAKLGVQTQLEAVAMLRQVTDQARVVRS